MASQVKITFKEALKALKLEAIVQNNSGALPYLSPGKNVVTVSVADPKALAESVLSLETRDEIVAALKARFSASDEGGDGILPEVS